jgi:hypothetical protein
MSALSSISSFHSPQPPHPLLTVQSNLSKSASTSDSKGAIIAELRASLADRDRLQQSLEEQKQTLTVTKRSTETIVSELKVINCSAVLPTLPSFHRL